MSFARSCDNNENLSKQLFFKLNNNKLYGNIKLFIGRRKRKQVSQRVTRRRVAQFLPIVFASIFENPLKISDDESRRRFILVFLID